LIENASVSFFNKKNLIPLFTAINSSRHFISMVIFDKLYPGRLEVTDAFFLLSTHETKICPPQFLHAGVYLLRKSSASKDTGEACQPGS